MKIKVSRNKLVELVAGFEEVKNLAGVKFAYVVVKNKQTIQAEMRIIKEAAEPSEQFNEFERERVVLCKKYCDKDSKGRPKIAKGAYSGVAYNPEFQVELAELKEQHLEAITESAKALEEYKELMNEEVSIDLQKIPLEQIPENISPGQLEKIMLIVKD